METNEFNVIMQQDLPFAERVTATYIRLLQDDCFSFYKPRLEPVQPNGFMPDYQRHLTTANDLGTKSAVWRKLISKYPGYFKAKDSAVTENSSNLHFLKQMRDHFKELNMRPQEEKCQMRINEFTAAGVTR
ncbi:MAG TPA: hypothetical protein ENH82_00770 [bacterium]|nr:hypothetical protein [bacterium]